MPSTASTPDVSSLVAAGRRLEELDQALRGAAGLGSDLDLRRVRTDLAHLRESLALLCDSAARPRVPAQAMVEVPDTPYDPAMWRGADDEGIGCRHC